MGNVDSLTFPFLFQLLLVNDYKVAVFIKLISHNLGAKVIEYQPVKT